MADALSFLQSVAGYTRAQQGDQTIKLGTVDPAYVTSSYPATLPKVTFDGEATLSSKRYPVAGTYLPTAGDRVVLLPISGTYVIVGALDSDASERIGGTLTVVTSGSTIATPAFTAVSFTNNWSNWNNGFTTCAYKKLPDGTVVLRGLAAGGSKTADGIFTLPTGYRPSATQMFATAASDAFGIVSVNSSGVVARYNGTATWVSLDPIRFMAE